MVILERGTIVEWGKWRVGQLESDTIGKRDNWRMVLLESGTIKERDNCRMGLLEKADNWIVGQLESWTIGEDGDWSSGSVHRGRVGQGGFDLMAFVIWLLLALRENQMLDCVKNDFFVVSLFCIRLLLSSLYCSCSLKSEEKDCIVVYVRLSSVNWITIFSIDLCKGL